MDSVVLFTLVAKRIDPAKFRVQGVKVCWLSKDDDTPENRGIVADVVANYDTLAAALVAEQAAQAEKAKIKAALAAIDLKSIRSMREWIADQPNAPQWLLDHEAAAIAERSKLDIK